MNKVTHKDESGPLNGYRVIDLSDIKGQHCARILADLGADVIKVEDPAGDPCRRCGPFYHDIPGVNRSFPWLTLNANKRGITLSLAINEGRDILRRLCRTAHFVVESFSPGHMVSLGLGYAELAKENPALVMTSITPFGQTGPYKDYKGSDLVVMAMGGLLYRMGSKDSPPVRISVPQSHILAGVHAAGAALVAHYYRQKTGRGQHVDISMQECLGPMLERQIGLWQHDGTVIERTGQRVHRGQTLHCELWRCKDGYVAFRVLLGQYLRGTQTVLAHMAKEGLAQGPADPARLAQTGLDKTTQEEVEAWEKAFAQFFLNHTKAEIFELMQNEVALASPVMDFEDILGSKQLAARDFWVQIDHPEMGSLTYPGAPFSSSEYSVRVRRRAPMLGEHNREVLCNELGLTTDQLASLKERNVI